MKKRGWPSLLLLCGFLASPAQAEAKKEIRAVYVETPIVIDGEMDEPEWQLATPAQDFVQGEPRTGEPATEPTVVRLLFDSENLYVGVYCFDSSGRESITLPDVRRDYAPFESDHFSLVIDTFNDNRNGFLFGTNPGGAKREGQVEGDGKNSNFDWDAIWHVKTRITDQGWQAEMAIPFKTLRFKDGHKWGVNFLRVIRHKNEETYWAPIPRPYRLPRVSLAGDLVGLDSIRQGRNLYVKPYVSAPVVRREGDDVDFVPEAGLDVKYGVTSGLTLDLTVNTDFSQVEADEQQVNLTRFSLFFPEKREFFLENADLFQFGKAVRGFREQRDLIPFFTRRIGLSEGRLVPILGGARLTGRVGAYRVGILSMQTDDFQTNPSTNFTVARVRRDLFLNSDIGALLVDKEEGAGNTNRTFGVDANLNFFRYLDIGSYLLKTDTTGIEGEDMAGNLRVEWNDRFWNLKGEHLSIQDNFNAEVGFVPRKGIRKNTGELTIRPRPGERIPWIREFRPSTSVEYTTDKENRLVTRSFDQNVSVSLEDGGNFWFTRRDHFERLDEPFEIREGQEIPVGDYNFVEYSGSFSTNKSRMFSIDFTGRKGGFYDGNKNSIELNTVFRAGYHFELDMRWSRENVELPSGKFKTHLVTTRLNYSFDTRTFLNALVQYNSITREVSSNIRFNFIYKPLSDLFIVYNERRSSTGGILDRALTAKLTYVFSF